MSRLHFALLSGLLLLLASVDVRARPLVDSQLNANTLMPPAWPVFCNAVHNRGRLALTTTNYGVFGTTMAKVSPLTDCFTGESLPSVEYPIGSGQNYLSAGAIWVGAVRGRDTLVSVGFDGWHMEAEFNPEQSPIGDLTLRSTLDSSKPWFAGAVSEQDYGAVYTDRYTEGVPYLEPDIFGYPHRPLNIQISQVSYSWSDSMSQDFVIFNCLLTNTDTKSLDSAYIGIFVDGDVYATGNESQGQYDDITGYIRTTRQSLLPNYCAQHDDTLDLAWIADDDNHLIEVPGVCGVMLLNSPLGLTDVAYNWWRSSSDPNKDYGPTKVVNRRDLGTGGGGTPEGDRNKYWLMSNHEVDFDQIYTATTLGQNPDWDTSSRASGVAVGGDVRFLLSIGPIDLAPGGSMQFDFAVVASGIFHQDADNYRNLPAHPEKFMADVRLDDLITHALRAKYTYDTPGIDTDSDGFAGQFQTCCIESVYVGPNPTDYQCVVSDTVWVSGDGVPDFKPFKVGTCIGLTGNVNCDYQGLVDLADLSALVSYLMGGGYQLPPSCRNEANINGNGIVDLADISFLVKYLTDPTAHVYLPKCP